MVMLALQGMCPMCMGMGLWMVLFWALLIAVVIAVVWMIVRRRL
ncbi:hypothetical protein BH20GEM3_BH20GEM3_02650 [soil metagenome]|jgi:hypothetical protein